MMATKQAKPVYMRPDINAACEFSTGSQFNQLITCGNKNKLNLKKKTPELTQVEFKDSGGKPPWATVPEVASNGSGD